MKAKTLIKLEDCKEFETIESYEDLINLIKPKENGFIEVTKLVSKIDGIYMKKIVLNIKHIVYIKKIKNEFIEEETCSCNKQNKL